MSGAPLIGVPVTADAVASALDRHRDYRVLRRMQPMRRNEGHVGRDGMLIGCAIDVETTGLDHRSDRIIELALQRFWADEGGKIVVTGRPHSWLEDPKREITPEITRLTGLAAPDLIGRCITDPVAASLISDADFVVAHNASFDRPFVEARLPNCRGGRWICSMRDIDWREAGFEGRTLAHLLMQMGFFFEAHRAQTDVTALLHLLDHPLESGGTVLSALVASASRVTWLIEAAGAAFEAKDLLKARGYRWQADARTWTKEVPTERFDEEIEWATLEVYGGLRKPSFAQITWKERYAARAARADAGGWNGGQRRA